MSRKLFSGMILFLLLFGMTAFAVQQARSSPATITVPDDYLTIQEAIDNADEGDTVLVKNGTYYESIVLDKTVSLIGESREATIIDAGGSDYGILITADNVAVRGLTVQGAMWGIGTKSSGCHISDNNLVGSHEGIFLDGREAEVTVEANVIADNYVSGNGDCGILLWTSSNNQILGNMIVNNDKFGIFLYSNASNNLIKRNEVVNSGIAGVIMALGCSYNTLLYNNISHNGFRGHYWWSGVVLEIQNNGNRIVANDICSNKIGLYQRYSSDDNTVYHNNFIDNVDQVYSDQYFPCINIWHDGYPSGGNYWSNYDGSDSYIGPYQNLTGSDGIGDTPHVIDNENVDGYPLMEPYTHPLGDVNYDDEVNMQDIATVARAYGSNPSHPNWNPEADVNKDEKVDLKDIAIVAQDFGK